MTSVCKSKNKFVSGFTLVEILLTLAVMAVMIGVTLPIYFRLQPKNDLDTASLVAVESLRRAQNLAIDGNHDKAWGVEFSSGNITLYAADNNGQKIGGHDEVFSVPESVVFSGINNTVFKKLTGESISVGEITITNSNTNDEQILTLNKSGLVEF